MSVQTDFVYQLERAGSAALDATCALRSASLLHLPAAHRRLLSSAIRKLEGAQQDLFHCRTVDPWSEKPQPPKPSQLELL